MSWLDRIAADTTISPRAYQIARIIVDRFAGPHGDCARFYDTDIGAFTDLPNGDIGSCVRRSRAQVTRSWC